jgi:hypothetical protein
MIPVRTDLPPVATLQVPRLRAGSVVTHRGRQKTVEGVILRGFDIHLKLQGGDEVHVDDIQPIYDSVPVYQREHQFWNKEPRKGELSVSASSSAEAVCE